MLKTLLFYTLFLIVFCATSLADTYKWEDKSGVHFTDNPNAIPKKYRNRAIAEARGDITTSDSSVSDDVDRRNKWVRKKAADEGIKASAESRNRVKRVPSFEEWKASVPGSDRMDNGALLQYYYQHVVPNY